MTGRTLDPLLEAYIDELNAQPQPENPTIEDRRAAAIQAFPEFRGGVSKGADLTADQRDFVVAHGVVTTRVYNADAAALRQRPTVAYIHGGGFVSGTLDSYDPDCRALAAYLDATVVSIDYRLAPEHPYPAGFEDCREVVRALRAEVGGSFGVAGDSAGGNLALAVSLALRDGPRSLDAQLLLYPAIDPDGPGNRSYQENGNGYLLTSNDMEYYYEAYLAAPAPGYDEWGAPSHATTYVRLQPSVVVTAEFDPLRDEGRRVAEHMVRDDVEVIHQPNPTLIHGFQQLVPRIPAAEAALHRAYQAFRLLLERAA